MAEGKTDELLSEKHKRERKELQGRIQVLKKTVCKGDKKKKREVTEEIAHLECELEQRHEVELANLNISQIALNDLPTETISLPESNNSNGNVDDASVPSQRISKAQRRRDKKAIAEKERNERIIEQETLNVFGKRSIETQAIKKILGEHELMIYDISSDGHCLYNAVAHQLKTNGEMPLSLQDLRHKTSVYLRENMSDFLPFLSNDNDEMLSIEQYEKYCDNVACTNAWGGDIELQVLSRVLECPIEIIQATGKPYVIGSEFLDHKKIILTYHRHLYELGAHYNSVTKYIKEDS